MNFLEEAKRISERVTKAESDLSDSEAASLVIGLTLISIAETLKSIDDKIWTVMRYEGIS